MPAGRTRATQRVAPTKQWPSFAQRRWAIIKDRFTDNLALLVGAFLPAAVVYGVAPAPFGRLSDHVGRRQVMASGLALAGVVAAIFPALPNILLLGALWTLEAVCVSAAVPAEGALVADLTGGTRRGTAYGLYSLAVGTGATLGPLLGGWLYDHVAHTAPFYTNAILLPLSALLVVLLPIEARRSWHTGVSGAGITSTPGSREVGR